MDRRNQVEVLKEELEKINEMVRTYMPNVYLGNVYATYSSLSLYAKSLKLLYGQFDNLISMWNDLFQEEDSEWICMVQELKIQITNLCNDLFDKGFQHHMMKLSHVITLYTLHDQAKEIIKRLDDYLD